MTGFNFIVNDADRADFAASGSIVLTAAIEPFSDAPFAGATLGRLDAVTLGVLDGYALGEL